MMVYSNLYSMMMDCSMTALVCNLFPVLHYLVVADANSDSSLVDLENGIRHLDYVFYCNLNILDNTGLDEGTCTCCNMAIVIGKCSHFLVDCFRGCLNDDYVDYDSGSDFGSDSDSCFDFDSDFPPLFLVDC